MKKLMIAAMGAATAGGLFAATAQVYDMTITVKSTECKDNKKAYSNVCAEDIQFYRAQATQKFYGKFWGCGCETLCAPNSYGEPRSDKSFVFWGSNGAFHDAAIAWNVLQLVGKNGTNIEGAFNLDLYTCDENGDANVDPDFNLSGAGYGTASVKACADEDNYVKSMSGNVVGIANVTSLSEITGCKYCGEYVDCQPWDFCDCVAANENVSAAFGTFTLKYNASQAKALAKGKWIDEANKFKSFVTDEFKCIAAANAPVEPEEPEFDPCPDATAALEKAQAAYNEALATLSEAQATYNDLNQGALACTQGTALTNALAAAQTAEANARAALATAAAEVPAVKNADDAVGAAKNDVVAKESALAVALAGSDQTAIDQARADLDTAQEALATAEANLVVARAAADSAKLAAYDSAKAAVDTAADATSTAQIAKNEWEQSGWATAKTAAKAAMDEASAAKEAAKDDLLIARINAEIKCD